VWFLVIGGVGRLLVPRGISTGAAQCQQMFSAPIGALAAPIGEVRDLPAFAQASLRV
jgi:hypothetical protein